MLLVFHVFLDPLSQVAEVLHKVSSQDSHGTEQASIHGSCEATGHDVLACEVETRDAHVRAGLSYGLEGEALCVVVYAVHVSFV